MKCNRCGECCRKEVCAFGVEIYKTEQAPCPGLKLHKGKHSCELINIASKDYQEFYPLVLMMGIGVGCTNPEKIRRVKEELRLKRLEANRIERERSQLKIGF